MKTESSRQLVQRYWKPWIESWSLPPADRVVVDWRISEYELVDDNEASHVDKPVGTVISLLRRVGWMDGVMEISAASWSPCVKQRSILMLFLYRKPATEHQLPYTYWQEAQLPQRNSASAAHVYLGWLTDRAVHSAQNTAESQSCTISDIQTLWFKNCWPKTHFVMK